MENETSGAQGCIGCAHKGMKYGPADKTGRRTIELATDAWSNEPQPPLPKFDSDSGAEPSGPVFLGDSGAGVPLPSASAEQPDFNSTAVFEGGAGWTDVVLLADDTTNKLPDGIVFGEDDFDIRHKGRRTTKPKIVVPGFEPSPGLATPRENPVDKFLYPQKPVVIKPDKIMRQMRRMLGLDKDDETDPESPLAGRDEGWNPTDPVRAPLFPLRPGTGVLGPWPVDRVKIGLWGGATLRGTLGGVGGIFVELPWNRVRIWIGVSTEADGRRIKPGLEIGGSILWD